MAVHDPTPRDTVSGDESSSTDSSPATDESTALGVGMAHLTVVPTNFEPPESDRMD